MSLPTQMGQLLQERAAASSGLGMGSTGTGLAQPQHGTGTAETPSGACTSLPICAPGNRGLGACVPGRKHSEGAFLIKQNKFGTCAD